MPAGAESGKKAVVLVSGGLDSATVLAIARAGGYACYAITFDYGQRHRAELEAARAITTSLGALYHRVVKLDIGWMGGSALTDRAIAVPRHSTEGIPATYVPARNTVFLSIALGWAEVLGAQDIFIGVNAIDYSGYPDCRPEYIETFERLARLATRAGVENRPIKIRAPLIQMRKDEIIRTGVGLGVDFALTISCYDPNPEGRACGYCDACRLRRQGFADAGITDPTRYL